MGHGQNFTQEVRAEVWDKSGGVCAYCNRKLDPFIGFSIDHVIPSSRGGTNDLGNLVASCLSCNKRKRDLTPEEWRGRELRILLAKAKVVFESDPQVTVTELLRKIGISPGMYYGNQAIRYQIERLGNEFEWKRRRRLSKAYQPDPILVGVVTETLAPGKRLTVSERIIRAIQRRGGMAAAIDIRNAIIDIPPKEFWHWSDVLEKQGVIESVWLQGDGTRPKRILSLVGMGGD